jgi:hypothetical protein
MIEYRDREKEKPKKNNFFFMDINKNCNNARKKN